MQVYTVVEANGKTDDADKLNEFATNIDKEVSEIPHFRWEDIDMVCCCSIHDKNSKLVRENYIHF